MFYLILPSLDGRQALISHLSQREIFAVFHYLLLDLSPMGRTLGARRSRLHANSISNP
jgi:dTDP-4-amino-4,6-dideoxygalactose transaminase